MRLILVLLAAGCAHVVRDTNTYTLEVHAALARQEEAAAALRKYAERAAAAGDNVACEELAGPALLIEATARPQASRALFLAGLSYPGAPKPPTDPGPPPAVQPLTTICRRENP
jgi:hypothetical protein